MKCLPIVAIDGPAGSGKSTIAKLLAKNLSYTHIDTGALYRGVALLALESGLEEAKQIADAFRSARFEFRRIPDQGNLLHIDGKNVSKEIRQEKVSALASKVAAYPAVREALLGLQRELGRKGGVVLEGRDIGTVVFPQAEVKIFLTASLAERAKRRTEELRAKGEKADIASVEKDMAQRDSQDSQRAIAPLKQAEDAIAVDTTGKTIEQVLQHLEGLVAAYCEKNCRNA